MTVFSLAITLTFLWFGKKTNIDFDDYNHPLNVVFIIIIIIIILITIFLIIAFVIVKCVFPLHIGGKKWKTLYKNFRSLTKKSGCARENDQQTGFYMIWTSVMKVLKVRLILYTPRISECCLKMKINLILLQVLPRIALLNISNTRHHCLTGKAQYTCHRNSTYVKRLFDV